MLKILKKKAPLNTRLFVYINEFRLLCYQQEILINVSMEDKHVQTECVLYPNLTTERMLILDMQVSMVVIILALYIQELLPN